MPILYFSNLNLLYNFNKHNIIIILWVPIILFILSIHFIGIQSNNVSNDIHIRKMHVGIAV